MARDRVQLPCEVARNPGSHSGKDGSMEQVVLGATRRSEAAISANGETGCQIEAPTLGGVQEGGTGPASANGGRQQRDRSRAAAVGEGPPGSHDDADVPATRKEADLGHRHALSQT